MSLSPQELKAIMPQASWENIDKYCEPLNAAMTEFDICDPLREAAFIAQVAHESGQFRYVREIASGDAYEGRRDLGNVEPGDGARFRGRGLIQITGRSNYERCGDALDLPLVDSPELLELPEGACRSAAWFWASHGLNELADKGAFKLITKRINGGLNGFAERVDFYNRALSIM